MKIEIRGDDFNMSEHTQQAIERKCRLVLGRIVSEVSDVRIIVRDENGPRRGVDLVCAVDIRLRGGAEVRAEAADATALAAAESALDRAARSAHRVIARRHDVRRDSIRFASSDALY